jgi:hypothetical protein
VVPTTPYELVELPFKPLELVDEANTPLELVDVPLTPAFPVDMPFTPIPFVEVPLTPDPLFDEPVTPVPRVDVPETPESNVPVALPSVPLTPDVPLDDDVLLNDVLPRSPVPWADVDFKPGPVPELVSVTHGDALEQLVNGPTSAPARELAPFTTNIPATANAIASEPNRVQLNIFLSSPCLL